MKENNFNLLNGTFSVKDALTILMELYSNKINFHQKDIFSKEERNHGDITHSKNRIIELNEERNKIRRILTASENLNKNVKINGGIFLEIID
ncbi:hypothetical protein [Flavobacterium okayamense]|uniref:Uncharacterized protein n=1 Tax=Flavobacterium okayamense TaxID=2830782 RepID=A0ABM7S480_9FLAO|nr:hypothetical protein [Flavobacterium okayamense]BCY28311.1 hypothetical protein KK2020170_11790 [Flavobacterium okayamense]